MPDTIKKVLAGAVVGALLVFFSFHVSNERARRDPAAKTGAPQSGVRPGAAASPGAPGGFSQAAVAVVAVPVKSTKLAFELEALGTANANESVEVTAKVANQVAAVRFEEGQQVRRGDVLVELDGAQARADLAAAEAALAESRSQYQRSRELYTTKVLSDSQIEQIEATFKANQARVDAARSRVGDTVVRAPFTGRVGLPR